MDSYRLLSQVNSPSIRTKSNLSAIKIPPTQYSRRFESSQLRAFENNSLLNKTSRILPSVLTAIVINDQVHLNGKRKRVEKRRGS